MTKPNIVRTKLFEFNLTQVWLIAELSKLGISVSKTELSAILKGVRFGQKANQVINNSLEILKAYETRFINK